MKHCWREYAARRCGPSVEFRRALYEADAQVLRAVHVYPALSVVSPAVLLRPSPDHLRAVARPGPKLCHMEPGRGHHLVWRCIVKCDSTRLVGAWLVLFRHVD
jgi:hypothetical protein